MNFSLAQNLANRTTYAMIADVKKGILMFKDARYAPWCTFFYVAPRNAAFLKIYAWVQL